MTDTYGVLALPAPAPGAGDVATDPALKVLLDFAQAILNAELSTAWAVPYPGVSPVQATFAHDPERESFVDKNLPALYGFRAPRTPSEWMAEDYEVAHDTITLQLVMASTAQARTLLRSPLLNGAAKALDSAIWLDRHPAYVKVGDTDPKAATLAAAPTAVRLSHATPTAPVVYSGASLDGAIGTAAITPKRAVTLTLDGDPTAWTSGSTITVAGTNVLGVDTSEVLTVPVSTPATLTTSDDYASVTSVSVDAQASALGTLSVGLVAYAGAGTDLVEALGALKVFVAKPGAPRLISIAMNGGGPPMKYPAFEWQVAITERFVPGDPDTLEGADVTFARSDGSAIERATY